MDFITKGNTYIHTSIEDFHTAVNAEIAKLRPGIVKFPSESELMNHWDDYRSVEDTAKEWLDWADVN